MDSSPFDGQGCHSEQHIVFLRKTGVNGPAAYQAFFLHIRRGAVVRLPHHTQSHHIHRELPARFLDKIGTGCPPKQGFIASCWKALIPDHAKQTEGHHEKVSEDHPFSTHFSAVSWLRLLPLDTNAPRFADGIGHFAPLTRRHLSQPGSHIIPGAEQVRLALIAPKVPFSRSSNAVPVFIRSDNSVIVGIQPPVFTYEHKLIQKITISHIKWLPVIRCQYHCHPVQVVSPFMISAARGIMALPDRGIRYRKQIIVPLYRGIAFSYPHSDSILPFPTSRTEI